jgi:serine/threonine protein kinase
MFVEYVDGGCLTELIYQFMKQLDEATIGYIMAMLLAGLTQLHAINRIHRDLKSDNILLTKSGEVA